MNMFPMVFCLVAAGFAGPLYAQVCSGGAGGGSDASGNQCNDAASVGTYANGADISPLQAAKTSGIEQLLVAPVVTLRSAKMSSAAIKSTLSAQAPNRTAKAAPPAGALVKTSKIELMDASPCSGGADGGMDVTGNQC